MVKQQIGYNNKATTPTVVERPDRVASNLIRTSKARGRKKISDWTAANNQAGNVVSPKRTLLYTLYEELVLDGDVFAEWETKRKLRLTGSDFQMLDPNNKPNEEVTNMLRNTWFTQLLNHSMDAKLWGHSLVEIKDIDNNGLVANLELVPRKHVIPETGLITINVGDEKGIFYRDELSINQWLFEIGETSDLGLLNVCAPYILFQRFALSAWSEFCELFAMPLRVGKTQSKDTSSLNRMEDMLISMATASYAVIDKDEEIEFVEAGKSDGTVYERLMNVCSSKISKILNGAVIGEASQGGSRSKEEVGQKISDLVTLSDMTSFENWMKQYGIPKLIALGYPFDGYRFEFKKPKDLVALIAIVTGLTTAGYKPKLEWVQDEFGIPLEEIIAPQVTQPNPKAQSTFFD